MKLSNPVLCLARSFLYYTFTFSTSYWSIQNVFLLDLVLECCMFLEICPFLLGCPICSYYSLVIFICLWYQLLFLFFNLLFCLFEASLSFSWRTWLMSHILFIFSKNQLLASLTLKKFFVPISSLTFISLLFFSFCWLWALFFLLFLIPLYSNLVEIFLVS